MAKREGIDRGRNQPPSGGKPGRVMSAEFKAHSDDGPVTKRSKRARANKSSLNVSSYPRQFQRAARLIDASLRKGG